MKPQNKQSVYYCVSYFESGRIYFEGTCHERKRDCIQELRGYQRAGNDLNHFVGKVTVEPDIAPLPQRKPKRKAA